MKIPLIGDTHIGARGSNPHVRNFIKKYMEYLFKDMNERGFDVYIQLGDALDSRTTLNAHDYAYLQNEFIPLHEKYSISGLYLDGNHDLAYKESGAVSWISLLANISNGWIERIAEPTDYGIYDKTGALTRIALLPWINQENIEETLKFIENSEAKVCCGHLELGGFEMYKGSVCEESRFNLNAGHFKKFAAVYSGHFHTKSQDGNIKYVGTPYPLTWQDAADAAQGLRGYHILDTDTNTVEFIPNPPEVNTFFKILTYDWNEINLDNVLQLEYKSVEELSKKHGLEGKVVKIIVLNRGNQKHYEDFMQAVRQCKTIDVTVIDNTDSHVGGDLGEVEAITTAAQEELSVQTDIISVLQQRVDKGSLDEKYKSQAKETILDVHKSSNGKGAA